MKITEDYVSLELAKLLKEKGFDEKCRASYNNDGNFLIHKIFYFQLECGDGYLAPTLQMACKWLRDVHNIHIGINPISGNGYNATIYDVADFDDYGIISDTEFFFHPEEAVEAALKYVLENLI